MAISSTKRPKRSNDREQPDEACHDYTDPLDHARRQPGGDDQVILATKFGIVLGDSEAAHMSTHGDADSNGNCSTALLLASSAPGGGAVGAGS